MLGSDERTDARRLATRHRRRGPGAGHRDATPWHFRPLPGLTGRVDLLASTVFVTPVGGMLEFSGHHLHSNVPNTSERTRFSIREFMSAADLSPVPEDVVALFDEDTETTGDLGYVPPARTAVART